MSCLCGIIEDGAVMEYHAFIYVLLRTAADDDDDTFRNAFHDDPVGTLSAVGHSFSTTNLGGQSLTLPTKADAQSMLENFLPDYDGPRGEPMNVDFNWLPSSDTP